MTELQLTSESEDATHEIGLRIGRALGPGTVVALIGTLGSGKTRLTQAIAAALEINQPVVSPTYTLCVPYSGRLSLLHMDAYRIQQPEEVDELDLFDLVHGIHIKRPTTACRVVTTAFIILPAHHSAQNAVKTRICPYFPTAELLIGHQVIILEPIYHCPLFGIRTRANPPVHEVHTHRNPHTGHGNVRRHCAGLLVGHDARPGNRRWFHAHLRPIRLL